MCLTHNLLIFLSLHSMFYTGIDTKKSEPDFCSETKLDSAFIDHTNQIRLTRKQWIWTYIETKETMSAPVKMDKPKYKLQGIAYISAVPQCQTTEGPNCADIQKAKDLVIMFYKMRTKTFAGAYQTKRVIDGVVTRLTDNSGLPFGLKPKGNMFASGEKFWPKKLSTESTSFDKRHTIVVYNPFNYEVIIVSNGDTKGWLCFNSFKTSKEWTEGWECVSVLNDWIFIGAFVRKNNIYVLSIKTADNRLFTISKDHELIDTNINVQNYFDCNSVHRSGNDQNLANELALNESESSEKSSLVLWLIIGFIIVVIIVSIFALIAFYSIRKTEDSESSKSESRKPKATPKPDRKEKGRKAHSTKMLDDKGKEVGDDKIGVLDSQVNWDIVVAQPSKATTADDKPSSPKPGASKKKT